MKCLITGGAGFIGSHLAEELDGLGVEIVVVDNFSTGKKDNLSQTKNCVVYEGDITDVSTLEKIKNEHNDIAVIFHLAAAASVFRSFAEPNETHRINFGGTLNVLSVFKNSSVKKIVYASSAAVYGDSRETPVKETFPTCPKSPYGVDKLAGEYYLLSLAEKYGFEYVCCRFFNVYGQRQDPLSPYSGVISKFSQKICEKLNGGEAQIHIYGDGTQTRDFVYVKDVASILKKMGMSKCKNKIYNVGTGEATSILSLVEILQKISQCNIEVKFAPFEIGDIKKSCSDNSLLVNEFGINFTPFELGLSEMIKNHN